MNILVLCAEAISFEIFRVRTILRAGRTKKERDGEKSGQKKIFVIVLFCILVPMATVCLSATGMTGRCAYANRHEARVQ